ncbi:MAG: ABC transporter permease [Sphingobacteriales bacterium]|nr:MAG: ABC transporter permease [Sphingobacteriales bacterium]TAF82115.1 MAG: ABC transporter permease [Sphingobacteriales bacterium]
MTLIKQIQYLIKKEIMLEWRSKYVLNGLLLYVFATIFVCYLSFKTTQPIVWNVLFWIIMLFAAVNAVAKSFIQESNGRLLYYYSIACAPAIIIAKTIYNFLLLLLISFTAFLMYNLVFSNNLGNPLLYLITIFLGSLSFSTVFTMTSAIASKAGNNGTLMAVLSFPLIIPLLMLLIKLSKNAMDGLAGSVSYDEIGVILLINVIVVSISLLLFPYLWRD